MCETFLVLEVRRCGLPRPLQPTEALVGQALKRDAGVRAVVWTGAGPKAFSAGAVGAGPCRRAAPRRG